MKNDLNKTASDVGFFVFAVSGITFLGLIAMAVFAILWRIIRWGFGF